MECKNFIKETSDKIYLVYIQLFTLDVKPGKYRLISAPFFPRLCNFLII